MSTGHCEQETISLTKEQANVIQHATAEIRIARRALLQKIIHLEDILVEVGLVREPIEQHAPASTHDTALDRGPLPLHTAVNPCQDVGRA